MDFTIDGEKYTAIYGGPEIELLGCSCHNEVLECGCCELEGKCPAWGIDDE